MGPDPAPGPGEKVLVSACLMGIRCRYDGEHRQDSRVQETLNGRTPIPVCPEQLGGLPTPRSPAGLKGGDGAAVLERGARVVDERGRDVTQNFIRGAEEAARVAGLYNARAAILKSRSPSCGLSCEVRGEGLGPGPGVTAALLMRLGFELFELGGDQ